MPSARKTALAALLCLILVGCGGSTPSTSAFKTGYERVRGPLNETGASLAQELQKAPRQTYPQRASAFSALAGTFHARLARLEALKPPPKLAGPFAAATRAANKVDADLHALSAAAAKHSIRDADRATLALGKDIIAMSDGAAVVKQKLGIK